MEFVQDSEHGVYYYGDEPATGTVIKDKLWNSSPKLIGVDSETISLKERIALGFSISTSPTCSFYFETFPTMSPAIPWHLLQDPSVTKVLHNAMFDLDALREYDIDNTNVRDTNVMARLLCYEFTGLMELSTVHQMEVHEAKEYIPPNGTMLDVPKDTVAKKCMQDSAATLKLYYELAETTDMDYFLTEMKLIPIMMKMSHRGILLDQPMRQNIEDELTKQVEFYRSICEGEGFNPGSPQQVSYILAKRGAYKVFYKLPFTNRQKTSLSTDVKVLGAMEDPLASVVLEYRKNSKLLSTYIKPWSYDTRAYTRFHLDAITGRPSSTDRNMQNIPGKYRKDGTEYPFNCRGCLLPDSGIWTDMDFSQIEPRVLAYLSGDKEMAYIFSQPKYLADGSKNEEADIHLQVANFMGVHRRLGKTVNLAMTYGATDQTIMESAQLKDIRVAIRLREAWGRKFPQAWDWIEATQEEAIRTGRARTVFGRLIRLPSPEEESIDGIKRKAIDYPCQGSAAEIFKRGLLLTQDLDLALQIHDEILADGYVPKHRFEPLENIAPFRTPVEVRYLERWE